MQLSNFKWSLAAAMLLGGAYLSGCESHDHHYRDRRDREVIVRDDRGWEHRGYYDGRGDWHGGYYDDRRAFHNDERTWGRANDRDFEHRDNSNWDQRRSDNRGRHSDDDDRDRR